MLVDLGVARSHCRLRVPNDNPCSEAAFETLVHASVFPERFGSPADARAFCEAFSGHRHPQPPRLAEQAWINPPLTAAALQTARRDLVSLCLRRSVGAGPRDVSLSCTR